MASAACINTEGVPVEFRVATILFAIMALFPMPVIMTRPLELYINSTASANVHQQNLQVEKLLSFQLRWFFWLVRYYGFFRTQFFYLLVVYLFKYIYL